MSSVQDQLAQLSKEFHSFRSDRHQSYKDLDEAQTRLSFIDKFWTILGWNVTNTVQVQVETRVGTKKPDYRFLAGKSTVFFVEAKKPIEKLKDPKHIFQAKSYGWSDNVPLVILMDFEEFRPFRTRTQPKLDKPEHGLLKKLDMLYTDYADRAQDLLNTFGREAVMAGSLADITKSTTAERNATVDKEFLKTLADWRERLASHIALRNSFDDDFALSEAVQRILDRLVFVRILEDRDIETEQHLEHLTRRGEENIYDAFVKLSQRLAPKYNGLLFNAHPLSEELTIDDAAFRPIVKELHANESPYRFDVIPVDVLGTIYERFLGDEIRLTTSGRAKVETKPEVRKAGGVYYTPQYIVEYIVENTIGKLLQQCKTPDDVRRLRICDPACGSGSFLLGAFDALIRWCEAWYAAASNPEKDWVLTLQPSKNRKKAVTIPLAFKTPEGAVRLTAYAKGRIVQDCLYGVDVDRQATEVAQMSLYIKVLEHLGEEQQHVAQMLDFKEALLPTLSNNIKCGNSLIGSDFSNDDLFGLSDKEQRKINPFDWHHHFPFLKQTGGFDAVIGNPPYVRQELLGEDSKAYFQQHYDVYHGMADLYSYFIEQSCKLLNPSGFYGVIVANKWMRANYGEPLRVWLKKQAIVELLDFGDLPVFESATTYPCILILQQRTSTKQAPTAFSAASISTLAFEHLREEADKHRVTVRYAALADEGWTLTDERTTALLAKLKAAGTPLGDYVQKQIYRGVLTGLNEAFVIDSETRNRLIAEDPRSIKVLKPFLAGRDVKRYAEPIAEKYLIFTRRGIDISQYPAIERHLAQFKKNLMPKPKNWKGDDWQGRKPGSYAWYEIQDSVDYFKEFEKPKIIVPAIVQRGAYSLDKTGFYSNDKTSIIVSDSLALLGILNSKATDFFMHSIASTKQGGFYEYKPMYLVQLPIPAIPDPKPLTALVEKMLDAQAKRKAARTDFERGQWEQTISRVDREIDAVVYGLYGLTAEEIRVVEQG
jgi:hypothetical protein